MKLSDLIQAIRQQYGLESIICVFCETILEIDAMYCSTCNDYKGLMTVQQFNTTYGNN